MAQNYEMHFHDPYSVALNMLANLDFKDEIDFTPLREFDGNNQRVLRNFMGGD